MLKADAKPETRTAVLEVKAATESRVAASAAFPIVGVGASAGALEAFKQLLSALPEKPGMAFVLIPHLDPMHGSIMRELLSMTTKLPVLTVKDGMRVEVDHVYVIPPNTEMTIVRGVLQLATRQRGEIAMPIDTFFRSLAKDQPTNAVGVILSGTASDGSLGVTAIKGEGGITFAQDSDSARFDSMPKSAVATGCVDFVLPPAEIAAELGRIRSHPYLAKAPVESTEALGDDTTHGFERLLVIVKMISQVDFAGYKHATIHRRILRRMALKKMEDLKDYVRYLEHHPAEAEALYQDFLIEVTSFFRNPEVFEALKKVAFPVLFKDRAPQDPVRVWVPGCSTGEEAYSHAICLLEYLGETRDECPLQVFGTDVNETAIKKARVGIFKESIRADVSPVRLQRFFHKVEGGYQISKSVRDVCIFARQNVLTDPPFSKMDIVSCRNLLIYLGPELQKKLIPILHYALKPRAYLMLGSNEGLVGNGARLFDVADDKRRIFVKKPVPSPITFGLVVEKDKPADSVHAGAPTLATLPHSSEDALKKADSLLLEHYAPSAVLLNENLDILQTCGRANRYLELSPGRASLNLLRMTSPSLMSELQKGVETARKTSRPVTRRQLRIQSNGSPHWVDFEVTPFTFAPVGLPMYLIVFNDTAPCKTRKAKTCAESGIPAEGRSSEENEKLKAQLTAAKEYIQSILEQSEASNEQLQSANEEIQSANEELQTTNEELQTSKEELESSNEELKTVNEEMQHRNKQLTHLANDLTNLLNSVNMPILMLGPDLVVTRFTPQAESVLGLTAADVGRPLGNIRLTIATDELEKKAVEVMRDIAPQQFSIADTKGVQHLVRLTPYRTGENGIEGVVLTLPNAPEETQRLFAG